MLRTRTPLSFWESGAWVEVAGERRQPKDRAAFFIPNDGRRVPRGWSVPQNQSRRWDRHRRPRRGVRGVVPGRSASRPAYGSALLSRSAGNIGCRLKDRFHLRTSFPGLCAASRLLVSSQRPRSDRETLRAVKAGDKRRVSICGKSKIIPSNQWPEKS